MCFLYMFQELYTRGSDTDSHLMDMVPGLKTKEEQDAVRPSLVVDALLGAKRELPCPPVLRRRASDLP